MTDDLVIMLCLGAIGFVLLGIGCVIGFGWGHHLGTLDGLRTK